MSIATASYIKLIIAAGQRHGKPCVATLILAKLNRPKNDLLRKVLEENSMMRQCILSFNCIVLLLACGIVHAQIPQTLQPSPTTPQEQDQFLMIQQQAIIDAKFDVEQNVSAPLWFLGGAACGIFTFAYAAIDTPQVPMARLLGKSPTYIAYYTTEYQSKGKRKRITNTCLGWGTFVVLYFTYLGATLE